ncbi:amidohydrolase [Isoptericola hypogeus]|uniref:Amidohydrolase n=1 Tax=Isoptericola hypogeus TaxID=300179 RepID=A0ABP4V9I9_9MICO
MPRPDLILTNATVLTLDAADTVADTVIVRDGVIAAVGSSTDLAARPDPGTAVVDLRGTTLVPGFVDGHSHSGTGGSLFRHAAVHAPPAGDVRTVADLLAAMHENLAANDPAPGERLVAWGWFPDDMDDGGQLTADVLDREFPDHRAMVAHVSGHGGVACTRILEDLGYLPGVPDPEGGTIGRYPGTDVPNGVLWEQAWTPLVFDLLAFRPDEFDAMLAEYARWGTTTVQDGAASWEEVQQMRAHAAASPLPVDVRSLVLFDELEVAIASGLVDTTVGGHTLQGVKLILDGSPQGKTAFLTEPYLTGGPNGEEDWRGLATMTPATTNRLVELAYRNRVQVYAHVNGDAAVDQLLAAHHAAVAAGARPHRRTVPIHSQVMRRDQLDGYAQAGFEPSMFTVHTLMFGDTHLRNLGLERASGISPMRSAIDAGLRPSNHSDYPVTPINPLLLLWSSVSRTTADGVVLGADERVTPLQGLRALTVDAAYQYGLEHDRGSIEVGKLADLAVLSANPLEVPVDEIRQIEVLRTFKRGVTVHEAS